MTIQSRTPGLPLPPGAETQPASVVSAGKLRRAIARGDVFAVGSRVERLSVGPFSCCSGIEQCFSIHIYIYIHLLRRARASSRIGPIGEADERVHNRRGRKAAARCGKQ